MKQAIYLISLVLSLTAKANAQHLKVVSQPYSGNTFYSGHAKHISSLDKIPVTIRRNVEGFLQVALGNLASDVHFSHGQVINQGQYFKKNIETYRREWIVPKYDLDFYLTAPILGIEKLNFRVRLDQYGQIVSSEWPRKKYNGENRFAPRKEVDKFALGLALKMGYDTSQYCVDLNFSVETETLQWAFIFPSKNNRDRVEQALIIACDEPRLIAYSNQRCRD